MYPGLERYRMKNLKTLILAIVGGFAIGIGGVIYLSLENKMVGAFMFTVGLYTIVAHGLNLFTGKIGYILDNKPSYWIDLFLIWVGNFIGTFLSAQMVLQTRISGIQEVALKICAVKTNDNLLSLFILGIFCGFLMFVAVDGYKRLQNPILLFICVATFILCGFEHCIADMFYFSLANLWNVNTLFIILIITLGNAIGSIFIPVIKFIKD
ncbi:MAG: formate/nitrite transporter family protein [Bacillota bacterium]|nr:formate/nitrite transporter family protein [Bacillota bacterium]